VQQQVIKVQVFY